MLVANPGFTQVPCLGGGRRGCSVPGAASAGMGAWIRTGDAEYSMTYVHLLDDAIGNYSGRAKVRAVAPGEGRLPPAPVRAERGPKVWAEGARVAD